MVAQAPEIRSLIPGRTVQEAAAITQAFESILPGRTEELLVLIGPFYDPGFSFQPRPTSLSIEQAVLEMPWLAVTDVWSGDVRHFSRNCTPALEVRQNIGTSLANFVLESRFARVDPTLSQVLFDTLSINFPTLWRACCSLNGSVSGPPGSVRKLLASLRGKPTEENVIPEIKASMEGSVRDAWREDALAEVIHHVMWWNLWMSLVTTTVLVATNDKSYDLRSLLEALQTRQLPLGTDLENRAVYLNI